MRRYYGPHIAVRVDADSINQDSGMCDWSPRVDEFESVQVFETWRSTSDSDSEARTWFGTQFRGPTSWSTISESLASLLTKRQCYNCAWYGILPWIRRRQYLWPELHAEPSKLHPCHWRSHNLLAFGITFRAGRTWSYPCLQMSFDLRHQISPSWVLS